MAGLRPYVDAGPNKSGLVSRIPGSSTYRHNVEQAGVNIKIRANPRLVEERSPTHEETIQGPVKRFDKADANYLHMLPKELMLVPKNRSNIGPALDPEGFTSFNGMPIGDLTQEDVHNMFRVVGTNQGEVIFGDDGRSTGDTAVKINGTDDIWNIGDDTFRIGDRVGWEAYSIDPQKRAKQLATRPNAPEIPVNKLVARPKRVDNETIHEPLQRAVDYLFDGSVTEQQTSELQLKIGRPTSDEKSAIALREFIMLCGLALVASLRERGLVKLTIENEELSQGDPLSSIGFDALKEAEDTIIEDIYKDNLVLEGDEFELPLTIESKSDEEFQDWNRKTGRALQWLAAKTGVFRFPQSDPRQPSPSLIESTVHRVLAGHMNDATMQELFNLNWPLGLAQEKAGYRDARDMNRTAISRNMPAQIESKQQRTTKRFFEAVSDMQQEVNDRVWGFATGYSQPGRTLPVFVRRM